MTFLLRRFYAVPIRWR